MVVEVRRLEGYGAVEPFLALMPTATLVDVVAVGDVVCFDGAPTDIERYDDLPGQTDYSAYYKAMGVTAQMEHDVSSLKVYPVDDPGWRNVMERQRMGWVNCLYSSGMRPETVQLIAAMVIGDTSTLENETRRAFFFSRTCPCTCVERASCGGHCIYDFVGAVSVDCVWPE